MDDQALTKLSEEQRAALMDDLQAFFCVLSPADQDFFSTNFKPADLPSVLMRKKELALRDQKTREMYARIRTSIEQHAAPDEGSSKLEDIVTTAAAAVGVGATAAVVASDQTAFYQGVRPGDLVAPLRTEFHTGPTQVSTTGDPESLAINILFDSVGRLIPAMTINLTGVKNGTEVKVNDLTTQGWIESLKNGGQKLLNLAEKGLEIFSQKENQSVGELLTSAGEALASGSDLAETVNNLKLKERAWKVIKQSAEAIEANYLDQVEKDRLARAALELTWDHYLNCPTCAVSFGADDLQCRVCGTARPEKPLTPDPRQQ